MGSDLEHVEVMQRKFDEFLKELDSHQSRVLDINQEANALIDEGHPEQEQIHAKRDEVNEAWHKLGTLTATRCENTWRRGGGILFLEAEIIVSAFSTLTP